jgi:hypothetical protein
VTAPRHDRLIGQILGDLGLDPQRLAGRGLQRATERVAEWETMIEEQGREQVRAYARQVAEEERERLATYRREAIESLDPSRSASAAAEYTLRAAQSSAVVVHLSVVGSWQP